MLTTPRQMVTFLSIGVMCLVASLSLLYLVLVGSPMGTLTRQQLGLSTLFGLPSPPHSPV
jgi:hypothetical protein